MHDAGREVILEATSAQAGWLQMQKIFVTLGV
jgi:hypothetical protein